MSRNSFAKDAFIRDVQENVKNLYRKTLEEAGQQEIFQAVCYTVKDTIIDDWLATRKAFEREDPKILYYMSMEFLMGRALGNNLINLKESDEVREALAEIGLNLDVIEDQEPDAALGNGGLGRLAACYLDSMTTLEIPATGYSICYELGIFKQKIVDGKQVELADNWLSLGDAWLIPKMDEVEEVRFGGRVVDNWDGSGQDGDDLYFNVSVNGQTYTFTVESYLCDNTTDVYAAVKNLKIGDKIDMEGFLYWYEGVNPHITSVTASK